MSVIHETLRASGLSPCSPAFRSRLEVMHSDLVGVLAKQNLDHRWLVAVEFAQSVRGLARLCPPKIVPNFVDFGTC